MAIGKAVSIAIDQAILNEIDQLQPSHLTRKPFVNQLLQEAIERRKARQFQLNLSTAE